MWETKEPMLAPPFLPCSPFTEYNGEAGRKVTQTRAFRGGCVRTSDMTNPGKL